MSNVSKLRVDLHTNKKRSLFDEESGTKLGWNEVHSVVLSLGVAVRGGAWMVAALCGVSVSLIDDVRFWADIV